VLAAGLGACVFALAASGGASASPAPNGYTNVTKVYSSAGCTIWPVPGELAGDVTVTAIGAAGATGPTNGAGGGGGAGGDGDEIVGTLTGFESPTQSLDVCVDYGGGSGGTAASATDDGGDGGGASGVSYGTDFTEPFIVAGGGGGGGSGALGGPGGSVGDAGTGAPAQAGPGGGASDFSFGPGGGGLSSNGTAGAKFNAAGPGQGGNGANTTNGATFGAGGGGGGYYGGGGGGSGVNRRRGRRGRIGFLLPVRRLLDRRDGERLHDDRRRGHREHGGHGHRRRGGDPAVRDLHRLLDLDFDRRLRRHHKPRPGQPTGSPAVTAPTTPPR
jgi:hypothetical protein